MTNSQKGGIAVGVGLVVLAAVYLCDGLFGNHHFYRAGKAVACADGSLFGGMQAEIIEYGLLGVQGLAVDGKKENLYIAEANRPVLILDLASDSQGVHAYQLRDLSGAGNDANCLDGECEQLDNRDIAILEAEAMISEDGKGKILRRALDKYKLGQAKNWKPGQMEPLSAPTGMWGVEKTLFVTNDPAKSDLPADLNSKGKKGSGSLYAIAMNQTAAAPAAIPPTGNSGAPKTSVVPAMTAPNIALLAEGLYRPSGVVAESSLGPVYVAEEDEESVKWAIFRFVEGAWRKDGYLASVPKSGQTVPRFLGLAIWRENCKLESNDEGKCHLDTLTSEQTDPEKQKQEAKIIFAAGPTGLYAFDSGGASIGRMVFDEPVSGVAVAKDFIYLSVGQMLCRISLSNLSENRSDLEAWKRQRASPETTPPATESLGSPPGPSFEEHRSNPNPPALRTHDPGTPDPKKPPPKSMSDPPPNSSGAPEEPKGSAPGRVTSCKRRGGTRAAVPPGCCCCAVSKKAAS